MLEIIEQMPTANENYYIDFFDDLVSATDGAADTINGAPTVAALDSNMQSSNAFTVSIDTYDQTSVTIRIAGGQPDTFYNITVTVPTAAGNTIPKVVPFHCMRAVFMGSRP